MQKKSKLNVFAFMMLIILGLTFQPAISTYAACPDDISSYWKLDEPTPGAPGGTYVDSFYGNDGTGNANPTAVAGQINGAQEFDGATTGIDVPADNFINWLVDESFSIEFWAKIDSGIPVGNQVIIGRDDPGTNLHWWVGIVGGAGTVRFVLRDTAGNGVTITGTSDITADGEWHHVVAVRDNSTDDNFLYVDGVEEGTANHNYTAGFGSTTAAINMGWLNLAPNFYFDGFVDEVALYDRALTATEIEDHYDDGLLGRDYCLGSAPFVPFPNDTISLWDLDELNGPDYFDSFNGNDGMGNADPTADPNGIVNGAQTFDGATTGIDVPANSSFNWLVDESFSIEFWVKIDGPTGAQEVAIGRSQGNPASTLTWWVGIEAGTAARFVLGDNDGGTVTLTGVTDITDNAWHHVVAVRDRSLGLNGQNLLYVDGLLDVAALDATYNAGFDSATADLNIGYWNFQSTAPSNHLDGMIDEVALYDRALTATEIDDHYDDGLAGQGIDDAAGGGGGGGGSGGGGGGSCFITTMF